MSRADDEANIQPIDSRLKVIDSYYFGIPPGRHYHNLVDWKGDSANAIAIGMPWSTSYLICGMLDSNIGGKYQPEGIAKLVISEGWTALAFWDRSASNVMGNISIFISCGVFNFAAMLDKAEKAFPDVWCRIAFNIVPMDRALHARTVRNYEA